MSGSIQKKKYNELRSYYINVYPYDQLHRWLSYKDDTKFMRREFSFTTLEQNFMRNKTFNTPTEMRLSVRKIVPKTIHIGAIYNLCPKKLIKMLTPEERELVFDIDITDFDGMRTCCSGNRFCKKCWKYMIIAAKILNRTLTDDLGFKHLLWVFSGMKGIHCWVCDEEARLMNETERLHIVQYLTVTNNVRDSKLPPGQMHPSLRSAAEIIRPYFSELCLEENRLFQDENKINEFLSKLPDNETIREVLSEIISTGETDREKWQKIRKYCKGDMKENEHNWNGYLYVFEKIMLTYCYPKFDEQVTTRIKHLLKSPFAVHSNGNVAVPFDIREVDSFDPTTVPTLDIIIEEMSTNPEYLRRDINNIKLKCLEESFQVFRRFVDYLIAHTRPAQNIEENRDEKR